MNSNILDLVSFNCHDDMYQSEGTCKDKRCRWDKKKEKCNWAKGQKPKDKDPVLPDDEGVNRALKIAEGQPRWQEERQVRNMQPKLAGDKDTWAASKCIQYSTQDKKEMKACKETKNCSWAEAEEEICKEKGGEFKQISKKMFNNITDKIRDGEALTEKEVVAWENSCKIPRPGSANNPCWCCEEDTQAGGNYNKYDFIVNPISGRRVSIYGKLGQKILKKYIDNYSTM